MLKATRPERGDRCSGLWSGNWYRVRAAECLEFALTITTNAMFGIETPMGRTPLQGASPGVTSPRAKAPDFAKPTSRLAFWRHLPQHEGRHSFSDGAWANLFSRCAAIHASTSGLTLVPRRRCPNSRTGVLMVAPKMAWKLAKFQGEALKKGLCFHR